ncbi:MAG: BatA and WFA domain-containing protein [Bacteroidales bacterium]|nr:BatA and WFA domain-containing protein [Bacteroidales bacterium]
MEFVNPLFLYGLLAVSIPVIIHLFNFRRFRKVYFTNVRFIREIKAETQKQSKLRHLLALIARILAIASIVLAFAQPYIPVTEEQESRQPVSAVSIYIDNSFSMKNALEGGNLLDRAKKMASEIALSYRNTDIFQLLTNDMEGRHQRFVSREELLKLLDEVSFSPAFRTAKEILQRQTDVFEADNIQQKTIYLISDFQKTLFVDEMPETDSLTAVFAVPLQAESQANLYVDSCWFASPVRQAGKNAELFVRIKNTADMRYEKIPVRLNILGKQRSVAGIDVEANGYADIPLYFTNYDEDIVNGSLEINDYPVDFDDKLFFSWYVAPQIQLLAVNGDGESAYLNSLFKEDTAFTLKNVPAGNINYAELGKYHVIFLNSMNSLSSGLQQEIGRYVENGGTLVIIPPGIPEAEGYNDFFTDMGLNGFAGMDNNPRKIEFINLEHHLFLDVFEEIPENIDLPSVISHHVISRRTQSVFDVLLEVQGGSPFLTWQKVQKGQVYLFASPFDIKYTDFPKHAIFVPVLYQIALSGVPSDRLYYTIGKNESIETERISLTGDEPVSVRNEAGDFEVIPEMKRSLTGHLLDFHSQVKEAGNYYIYDSGRPVKGISFNYNRSESVMDYFSPDELKEVVNQGQNAGFYVIDSAKKPVEQTISEFSKGILLWKWFVVSALVFLLLEGMILRFMK